MRGVLVGVAAVVGLVGGELVARAVEDRGALVRAAVVEGAGGDVVWRTERPEVVREACTFAGEGAVRVVVLGGAALRGVGLDPGDVFTERARLSVDASQVCVDNWSQPGAGADQLARDLGGLLDATPRPDTVVLGVEPGFTARWRRLDGLAIRGEVPAARWLGTPLAASLVDGSALVRAVLVRPAPPRGTPEALAALDPVVARAAALGVEIVLWRVSARPQGAAADDVDDAALQAWAEGRAPVVHVSDLLGAGLPPDAGAAWGRGAHGALAVAFTDNLRRLVIARAHGW